MSTGNEFANDAPNSEAAATRRRRARAGEEKSERNRLEGFTDATFAIVLTLLVLDLLPGEHVVNAEELLGNWPAYLAYLAAFFTTAALWLSHHQTFTRLASVDTKVLLLNVALLLGVALVPWPTALIANALRDGTHEDQFAAVVVYAIVVVLIGIPWTILGLYISGRRNLLKSGTHAREMRVTAFSALGCIVVAGAGIALGVVSPVAALALFLLVPLAFIVSAVVARSAEDEDEADDEA